MIYAQRHLLDGKHTLQQIAAELSRLMELKGLSALCEACSGIPFLARPRAQEIFACLNRCRSLRLS